jgi:peptidoglycan/LPS O-acetylase OafA/YrhL
MPSGGVFNLKDRPLATGDEAGTAPGDRLFRPDVEGLRAVAVAVVVLYHANVPGITGGYVGVDVFFVISGFVITGLLLRERSGTGTTSLLSFYARRCRRILPAATLVIIVTAAAAYPLLGFVIANNVADDGRWAAAFLANFHFAASGTNYLSASFPPSPLQNFWTLSVEEQFYAVFPVLLLVLTRLRLRLHFEARLAIALVAIIIGSFTLSVLQTSTNPTVAYFSPFTRAWELALGGVIALATRRLCVVPVPVAAGMTWLGMGAIVVTAFTFTAQTAYPGSLVAIPVLGAALVIAGGAAQPRHGAEALLRRLPFQWLGQLSYSLYLWHWPILVLAAESRGLNSLPAPQSLWWVALAMVASVGSYLIVENPIRHAQLLTRVRGASIALGVGLVSVTIGIMTVLISTHGGSDQALAGTSLENNALVPLATVRQLVTEAGAIHTIPQNLQPPVSAAFFDFGVPKSWGGCSATYAQTTIPSCTFGDPHGTHTIVLMGDSHALMWAQAINDIAIRARWKFVLLAKAGCPSTLLPVAYPPGLGSPAGRWPACDRWRQVAIQRVNQIRPSLLVLTQAVHAQSSGKLYSAADWKRGLEETINRTRSPSTTTVVLGNIPQLPQSAPDCLARHVDSVQACAFPPDPTLVPYNHAEQSAAAATGADYIDVTPWFCSRTCPSIVSHYEVYVDAVHVTNTYARFLEGVLGSALHLPVLQSLGSPPIPPHSTVLRVPHEGAVLSGTTLVDATTEAIGGVTRVEFQISGHGLNNQIVGTTSKLTRVGWLAGWNTTTDPNGAYTLRAVTRVAAGRNSTSSPVKVTVKNIPTQAPTLTP